MRGGVFSETLDRDYLNGLSEKDRTSVVEHLFALMESRSKGCPFCSSSRVIRKGYSSSGTQRYACKSCGKGVSENENRDNDLCLYCNMHQHDSI